MLIWWLWEDFCYSNLGLAGLGQVEKQVETKKNGRSIRAGHVLSHRSPHVGKVLWASISQCILPTSICPSPPHSPTAIHCESVHTKWGTNRALTFVFLGLLIFVKMHWT